MSIRNGEIGDLVLDATRTLLLRGGGRKLTVSEIAREAGVSRPTVYRRWPDITEIIRDLLTREVLAIVDAALLGVEGGGLDGLMARVVRVVAALRANELISTLWRERRDFMSPYFFERLGTSQQSALAVLADLLSDGQARGEIRPGDAKRMASTVLLICQSFLQSVALVSDILADDWGAELHMALVGYLRPGPDGPGRGAGG